MNCRVSILASMFRLYFSLPKHTKYLKYNGLHGRCAVRVVLR